MEKREERYSYSRSTRNLTLKHSLNDFFPLAALSMKHMTMKTATITPTASNGTVSSLCLCDIVDKSRSVQSVKVGETLSSQTRVAMITAMSEMTSNRKESVRRERWRSRCKED